MIKEDKSVNVSIFIYFFSTLLSFYFPSLGGIRIFDFVSFILLIFVSKNYISNSVNGKKIIIYFYFFTLFIIISLIVSLLNKVINLYIFKFFGTFFTIIYGIIFFNFFEKKPSVLLKAITFTVYLHALFFYLQVVLFLGFGKYIDFIEPVTGNSSRNIGGEFNLDTSLRFSGLFGEAAAYSLFILSLMSIILLSKKKLKILDFFVLLSIPLSTSASGTIYLIIYLLIYFVFYNKSSFYKRMMQLISVIIIFITSVSLDIIKLDYLSEKIGGFEENSSYQYRVGKTNDIMSDFSENQIMFGIGYANMDISENKGSTYSVLLIEHGLVLGGLFLLSILLLMHSFNVKYYNIFFVFLLFLGTYVYSQIQFWIWIISICILSVNEKNNKYE